MSPIDNTTSPSGSKEVPLLSRAALKSVPSSVLKPGFEVAKLRSGIVHLGCGAFHRAHQAAITQEAIDYEGESGLQWGIETVCMNRRTLFDQLRAQENLYSLLLREPEEVKSQLIGVFTKVLHALHDEVGIHRRLVNPDIKIVSLSVTPGGYYMNLETGELNAHDPHIVHDLENPDDPHTIVGILARAFAQIRDNGTRPPVVLSCDNLTRNGKTASQVVTNFIRLYDDTLADWVETNVQFPNTVVDRIAQPETPQDLQDAQRLLGYRDLVPVPTEPLWDWSIEEFEGPRPQWDALGARFVPNIEAYELGKLRLLNAAHMLLAYLGALDGQDTIAAAVNNPVLAALARQFMVAEAGGTLDLTHQQLLETADTVLRRFGNPAIRQEITRISRNGSEKMIPRVTDALRENIAAHRETHATLLLIAAWIYSFYLKAQGKYPLEMVEPLVEELTALAAKAGNDPVKLVDAFLSRTDIFGNLAFPGVREELIDNVAKLLKGDNNLKGNVNSLVKERLKPEFGGSIA